MSIIRDRFEWIPLTIYGIFRNKRRSFAMISGIILGVTILSGIFIYNEVLQEQNFASVVENASYEVRVDILDNETVADLNNLANLVKDDGRISDYTILGGEPEGFIPSIIFENQEDEEHNEDEFQISLSPVFIENDFAESEIAANFITTLEGSLDLSGGNKTVISRTVASLNQYEVGQILSSINISMLDLNRGLLNAETYNGYLTNVEIVGIYDEVTGNAGIFSEIFAIEEVYFSVDILDEMAEIKKAVVEEKGFLLAIKIDTSKFSIDDPTTMNEEINTLINFIVKEGEKIGIEVAGNNEITFLLLPFQISSFFITLFDFLLAAPVVILSLYLLFFGLEMSLEERRREIAIKKVQGADSKQIFSEMRSEAIVLFVIGYAIGYMLGIIGAWVISSSVGFMKLNLGTTSELLNFITYDQTAVIWSLIVVGGIMTLQIIRSGRAFIDSEVSESVQQYEETKEGFIKRNNVDVILFLIGVIGIILTLLENQFGVDLNLNFFLSLLINGLGPFFLWIGGAIVGARVTKYIPLKFERIFLSLPGLSDINRIIRSGLRRRGDTGRLAIIIVLTLSIATLAAAQGNTERSHIQRNLEYQIGADFQVNFATEGDFSANLKAIDGFEEVNPIYVSATYRVLDSTFRAYSMDFEQEHTGLQEGKNVGIWHVDSFVDMTPTEALQKINANPNGVIVARGTLNLLTSSIGDSFNIKVLLRADPDAPSIAIPDIEVLGVYDHAPGAINSPSMLTNPDLLKKINALADNKTINAYSELALNSSTYLVDTSYGEDITNEQVNKIRDSLIVMPGYKQSTSLYQELNSDATQSGTFGVSGLLSLNFVVAVSASFISTFAFSAILMERRRREFAVLRAIGARKSQIYKLALGENTMMVITAVIWGSIIGLGITYQFNGVFELFGVFLGGGPLDRIVEFPFQTVAWIGALTAIGMLVATIMSVRSAANQDLSTATRVI